MINLLSTCYGGRRRPVPKRPKSPDLHLLDVAISRSLDAHDSCFPELNFFSELGSTKNNFYLHPIGVLETEILQTLYGLLIDTARLKCLQDCGAINAGADCQHVLLDEHNWVAAIHPLDAPFPALLPLSVAGDGNCLLHAVSKAIWGVCDSPVTEGPFTSGESFAGLVGILREGLRTLLDHPHASSRFRAAWRAQKEAWDREEGITEFSEEQCESEWRDEVLFRARTNHASLSEIHVFALAHVVRRPIVVLASDVAGASDELGVRCNFAGVYLPALLPLQLASQASPAPILLGYAQGHFVPLVAHLPSLPEDAESSQACPTSLEHRGSGRCPWPRVALCARSNRPGPGLGRLAPLPVPFCRAAGMDPEACLATYLDAVPYPSWDPVAAVRAWSDFPVPAHAAIPAVADDTGECDAGGVRNVGQTAVGGSEVAARADSELASSVPFVTDSSAHVAPPNLQPEDDGEVNGTKGSAPGHFAYPQEGEGGGARNRLVDGVDEIMPVLESRNFQSAAPLNSPQQGGLGLNGQHSLPADSGGKKVSAGDRGVQGGGGASPLEPGKPLVVELRTCGDFYATEPGRTLLAQAYALAEVRRDIAARAAADAQRSCSSAGASNMVLKSWDVS